MPPAPGRDLPTTLWIAGALFCTGFAAHGLGLLLHELGGHALVAVLLGARHLGHAVTYFGHGFVRYAPPPSWGPLEAELVAWAGIAATAVAGGILFVAGRRLVAGARFAVRFVGALFVAQPLFYVVVGMHHVRDDPAATALRLRALGIDPWSWGVPLAAYVAFVAFASRAVLRDWVAAFGPSRVRLVTAFALASALYATGYRVEQQLRSDVPTSITQRVLVEARESAAQQVRREEQETGRPLAPARVAEIEREARPFPIAAVLALATAAAIGRAAILERGRAASPEGSGRPGGTLAGSALAAAATALALAALGA
jgi:hypothetical protein